MTEKLGMLFLYEQISLKGIILILVLEKYIGLSEGILRNIDTSQSTNHMQRWNCWETKSDMDEANGSAEALGSL